MSVLSLSAAGKRMRWEMARIGSAMGPAELVAVSLLVLWIGLHVEVLAPLGAQADAQTAQLEGLQQDRGQQLRVSGRGRLRGTDTRQDFLAFLPAESRCETQLLALHQLADHGALQMGRVDYHAEPVTGLPVTRLSLRVELRGTYAAQRQFLHGVLAELPNLAVQRLSLKKAEGAGDSVFLQIEASLYFRAREDDTP